MTSSPGSPKALNLRFPDPAQRAAIEAAARQEGMSMQEYILQAAVDRATAVEKTFLAAFQASQARSGEAFRDLADLDLAPEQREAEQTARRDLDAPARGHAA
ncbi:type II toxin -antitoxin system TacA 1-like antitoxin [Streptomyces longisporoflavus]|uniref:DUF1778 domain-containing protein n=1 Tax=Streptomyces longisporoflavus TaxID=28044 RepID=A0ABW7R3C6_9ACTN